MKHRISSSGIFIMRMHQLTKVLDTKDDCMIEEINLYASSVAGRLDQWILYLDFRTGVQSMAYFNAEYEDHNKCTYQI